LLPIAGELKASPFRHAHRCRIVRHRRALG
jgi:hypothetical protein